MKNSDPTRPLKDHVKSRTLQRAVERLGGARLWPIGAVIGWFEDDARANTVSEVQRASILCHRRAPGGGAWVIVAAPFGGDLRPLLLTLTEPGAFERVQALRDTQHYGARTHDFVAVFNGKGLPIVRVGDEHRLDLSNEDQEWVTRWRDCLRTALMYLCPPDKR